MKFTVLSTVLLSLASLVIADEQYYHYFTYPTENAEFYNNEIISFTANSITNDADETIIAKLYNACNDEYVQEVGRFTGSGIVRPSDLDDWTFQYLPDLEPGSYYIVLYEKDADGGIDDDNEEDLQIRSYNFFVNNPDSKKRSVNKRSLRKRSRQAKFNTLNMSA